MSPAQHFAAVACSSNTATVAGWLQVAGQPSLPPPRIPSLTHRPLDFHNGIEHMVTQERHIFAFLRFLSLVARTANSVQRLCKGLEGPVFESR